MPERLCPRLLALLWPEMERCFGKGKGSGGCMSDDSCTVGERRLKRWLLWGRRRRRVGAEHVNKAVYAEMS